jgi:aminoglycoside phosphotransferase (APT) family kinase protein
VQPGQPGEPQLVPVLPQHRFDEAGLAAYLAGRVPGYGGGALRVRQFQGGQSNPTFLVEAGGAAWVLRKKPPGPLLPSAHAVDREVRVLRALEGTGVPVPRVVLFCGDEGVIGTPFYLMEHVAGRVFTDRAMPGCAPGDRAAAYADMARVLAALHGVDWRAAGLEGFGKPQGYVARQVRRWTGQYLDSKVEDCPAMDSLAAWLAALPAPADEAAIAHGDYRLGNLVLHPAEPRVVAVLDWELATLGHPHADLAYNCHVYHLPVSAGGLEPGAAERLGIPSEAEYVAAYCRHAGRPAAPGLEALVVFSMFRLAAIAAGVYRRALDGNAADAGAIERGRAYRDIAAEAWRIAQSLG